MTIKARNHEAAIARCAELATLVDRHTVGKKNGIHTTAIDSLEFTREYEPISVITGVSELLLGIVVQGTK